MSHIIWWIIVGGLAGILAKALMPGNKAEPTGCLMTIGLGIVGSLITGFLMRALLGSSGTGWLIPSIIGATLGAMLLIYLLRSFWKEKSQ